jgi:hypothetical protein
VSDVWFAMIAIAAGALFCFAGAVWFRVVIAVWGAFVGFALGAGLIATGDDGFLRTGVSWIVGLAFAIAFALVAYLFYEVAVVLAMASIGIALGTALMAALGVDWTWIVVLVALALGVLFAIWAVMANMPLLLLVVLTALAGAAAITTGIMLLFGAIDTANFDEEQVTAAAADDWWWYAVYAVLAVAGMVVQFRGAVNEGHPIRESWEGRGPTVATS